MHCRMGFAEVFTVQPDDVQIMVRGTFGVYSPGTNHRSLGIGSNQFYPDFGMKREPDIAAAKAEHKPLQRASVGPLEFGGGAVLSILEMCQKAFDTFGVRYDCDPSLMEGLFFVRGSFDQQAFDDVMQGVGEADPMRKSVRSLSDVLGSLLALLLPEWQAVLGQTVDLGTLIAGFRMTVSEAKRILPGAPRTAWRDLRDNEFVTIKPTISWIVASPGARNIAGTEAMAANRSLIALEPGLP